MKCLWHWLTHRVDDPPGDDTVYTLVASSNRGRYALDDPETGHDVTSDGLMDVSSIVATLVAPVATTLPTMVARLASGPTNRKHQWN